MVETGNLLWDTAHNAPAYDLTVDGIHTYHVTAGDESVLVHNNSRCDPELVAELEANGVRHTPANIQRIGRNGDGDIIFLETGNETSGLAHILQDDRVANFADRGVAREDIADLVFEAATEGADLGQARAPNAPGRNPPRTFEIEFRGVLQRVDVTVSTNGFIVQANLTPS